MKCKFNKAWSGPCNIETGDAILYCKEHIDLKCCVCGNPATHDCAETGGFVCGAPLCDGCEHKLDKEGTNGIMCSGGHCKKGEQEYHNWLIQEIIKDNQKEFDKEVERIKQAKTGLAMEKIAVDLIFYKNCYEKHQIKIAELESELIKVKR